MTTSPSSSGIVRVSSAELLPSPKPVKTWVVNDGTREPWTRISCSTSSTRSSIVAPGWTFGATAAIVASATPQARSITASSSGDFVRRSSFTSDEPVTSCSGDRASVSWITVSAQIRSPTASVLVAPRPRAACLEQRRAVVALAHDDELARQLAGHVEQRHHPRQHEDRLAVGAEEGARDPAVRVLRLAEGRDHPLDAGEVLEIRGRREEEQVDAGLAHPLGEPPPPLGVVEHAAELRAIALARWPARRWRSTTCASRSSGSRGARSAGSRSATTSS